MITVDILNNILAYYHAEKAKVWTSKDTSYHNSIRALGVMEGMLLAYGQLQPNQKFNYKEISVVESNWLGKKKTVIRKQTYQELIVEEFETLIKNFK